MAVPVTPHLRLDACAGLSSALRQMLDDEMLEAVLGRRNYGKIRKVKVPPDARAIGSRWRGPSDLRKFAPSVGRPLSFIGARSFHFAAKSVRRDPDGGGSRATEFETYVSNEAKVDTIEASLAERYLVAQKGEVEEPGDDGRADLLLSSSGATLPEREKFWNERSSAVRQAGKPALILQPVLGSEAKWRALADDVTTPPQVARLAANIAQNKRGGGAGPAARSVLLEIEDPAVLAWAGALRWRFGKRQAERMVHFRRPRSGQLQLRLDFELPVELGPCDRSAVVQGLFRSLHEHGIPVTLVVHRPARDNHPNNFHVHGVVAPAVYEVGSDGRLDHGKSRQLRPGQLATMLERDAPRTGMSWKDLAAEDMSALRRLYARLCNDRLERSRFDVRLDHRSYAQMGIDQSPQEHLGSAASTLVKAGCAVGLDHENAIRSWAGVNARRLAKLQSEKSHHARVMGLRDLSHLKGLEALGPDLIGLREDYASTARRVEDLASQVSETDMLDEMARSAAERLRASTSTLLSEFDPGTGATPSSRNERHIRARNNLAAEHLEAVSEISEPWRERVEASKAQLVADRRMLTKMEQQIRLRMMELKEEKEERKVQDWWSKTILEGSPGQRALSYSEHFEALIIHLQRQNTDGYCDAHFIDVYLDNQTNNLVTCGFGLNDLELLQHVAFKTRVYGQLAHTEAFQGREIARLLRAVEVHGLRRVAKRQDGEHEALPRSVTRLYDRYRDHPTFLTNVDASELKYATDLLAKQQLRIAKTVNYTVGHEITPKPQSQSSVLDEHVVSDPATVSEPKRVSTHQPTAWGQQMLSLKTDSETEVAGPEGRNLARIASATESVRLPAADATAKARPVAETPPARSFEVERTASGAELTRQPRGGAPTAGSSVQQHVAATAEKAPEVLGIPDGAPPRHPLPLPDLTGPASAVVRVPEQPRDEAIRGTLAGSDKSDNPGKAVATRIINTGPETIAEQSSTGNQTATSQGQVSDNRPNTLPDNGRSVIVTRSIGPTLEAQVADSLNKPLNSGEQPLSIDKTAGVPKPPSVDAVRADIKRGTLEDIRVGLKPLARAGEQPPAQRSLEDRTEPTSYQTPPSLPPRSLATSVSEQPSKTYSDTSLPRDASNISGSPKSRSSQFVNRRQKVMDIYEAFLTSDTFLALPEGEKLEVRQVSRSVLSAVVESSASLKIEEGRVMLGTAYDSIARTAKELARLPAAWRLLHRVAERLNDSELPPSAGWTRVAQPVPDKDSANLTLLLERMWREGRGK